MLVAQARVAYLTDISNPWRDADFRTRFYTLCTKGAYSDLKSHDSLRIQPKGEPLIVVKPNAEGCALLRRRFGVWAALQLRAWGYTSPTIVPVPNSNVTLESTDNFPTAVIAREIANSFGPTASVAPIVRFKHAMPKARKGGTRDRHVLRHNMVLIEDGDLNEVVLFDDVVRTGGHLLATKDIVGSLTIDIQHAVAVALATKHQFENPQIVPAIDLEKPLPGYLHEPATVT